MKKAAGQKSRDTVPFKILFVILAWFSSDNRQILVENDYSSNAAYLVKGPHARTIVHKCPILADILQRKRCQSQIIANSNPT
jgi:hypothetical protein